MEDSERKILSLREKITLIGDSKVKEAWARIDTGAHTSSIDVKLAAELKLGPIIKSKTVKSASGVGMRPVIKAKLNLHGQEIESEFTIANRDHLKYSVLVGRNILRAGKFLIDPTLGQEHDLE